MDLLDRVGQKTRNKSSPDRMGLFQPQRRKAETVLLAWLSAPLKTFGAVEACARITLSRPRWRHSWHAPCLQGATNTIHITPDQVEMHRPGVGAPGETVGRTRSC